MAEGRSLSVKYILVDGSSVQLLWHDFFGEGHPELPTVGDTVYLNGKGTFIVRSRLFAPGDDEPNETRMYVRIELEPLEKGK